MDELLTYLNALPTADQRAFAERCETTVGYLRKAISVGQRLGQSTCAHLEQHSGGALVCERLNPYINWHRTPDAEWPWHPLGRPLVDPTAEADAAQVAEAGEGA